MHRNKESTPQNRGDDQVVPGIVLEALPNTHFKVQVGNEVLLAYLSGKMRLHRIRVLVGDKVEVLLDSYGGKGRIIKRT
ncbi:MAG: translation initiation factor IF-1 [Candidatus Vogelbacteria bacterium RIFOXYD1_FULL_46_19]|uniref:Translation initiation factor IF-1 n=1 Tax=Candidatus Vogelbacteria bacterium RIFOXYD1_FULL_46_19 TaxID=1802439 RepID=A0A1G2QH80_9BACT|nr:MAG: translation initiation factor IF-1 [Candidatus Vogelbacteria bacterium RIFOXYD1_FULL_46_19]